MDSTVILLFAFVDIIGVYATGDSADDQSGSVRPVNVIVTVLKVVIQIFVDRHRPLENVMV